MSPCVHCKKDTSLYDGGVPICLECADARDANRTPPETETRIRTLLMQAVSEARARSQAASEVFKKVMEEVPGAFPHPDGAQRIHRVSRELSDARKEVMRAHNRLNEFLSRGIIPDDLK